MKSRFQPWQFLHLILAGWINRRQQEAIFFGERSLQATAAEFLRHFHAERNHQGIGNRLIEPGEEAGRTTGEVVCRERLGGMLRYYNREAA